MPTCLYCGGTTDSGCAHEDCHDPNTTIVHVTPYPRGGNTEGGPFENTLTDAFHWLHKTDTDLTLQADSLNAVADWLLTYCSSCPVNNALTLNYYQNPTDRNDPTGTIGVHPTDPDYTPTDAEHDSYDAIRTP